MFVTRDCILTITSCIVPIAIETTTGGEKRMNRREHHARSPRDRHLAVCGVSVVICVVVRIIVREIGGLPSSLLDRNLRAWDVEMDDDETDAGPVRELDPPSAASEPSERADWFCTKWFWGATRWCLNSRPHPLIW